MNSYNSLTTKSLYFATQIIWYLSGLLQFLLIFRLILKLTGANPSAGFTSFIYDTSFPFVSPFINVFNVTMVEGGGVFEWSTLLAMLIYALIAWGIIQLFLISKTVSISEAANKLNQE